MLHQFCSWLSETGASRFVQSEEWIIPTLQSVHILAIGILLSISGLIGLRVFIKGLVGTSLDNMVKSAAPWIWGALVVLGGTGVVLIIGEPTRELLNPAFRIKMGLLAFGIAFTASAHHWLARPSLSHGAARLPICMKIVAVSSFLIWLPIAAAGRWIAYGTEL